MVIPEGDQARPSEHRRLAPLGERGGDGHVRRPPARDRSGTWLRDLANDAKRSTDSDISKMHRSDHATHVVGRLLALPNPLEPTPRRGRCSVDAFPGTRAARPVAYAALPPTLCAPDDG